ncbi:hypothetical protein ACS8YF_16970 [Salinisphaera sp. SWV1]|uniref:hypothetical protein n=1 Tax=Salinisphaera sp. SWV1 TaxID=3454139 RepID=UPI003F84011E
MKPDISEFSYGYAITEELAAKLGAKLIGAPTFPSLYQEGKIGGGYDVKIPLRATPIFLQFKLSDYLKRSSAKENQLGLVNVPYYRMHLRPLKHSYQHELLLNLENSGESVFYIAPEFYRPDELNSYYLNRSVLAHSAAFSPADIGVLPDDQEHYVVFEKGSTIGYRCSEDPEAIPRIPLREGFRYALRERGVESRTFGQEGMRQISLNMLGSIEKAAFLNDELGISFTEILGARAIIESRGSVESAAYLARTFFGCELLVIDES